MTKRQPKEPLARQIKRLADFIMAEVPGEPSQSAGAVDTAIRLLRGVYKNKQVPMSRTMPQ